MELIADSKIILASVDDLLKPVVVAMNFDSIRYDSLDSVIVPHYFDRADHSVDWHVVIPRHFREHLVVVPRDYQRRNGIARSNFDGAIVSPEYDTITRLHDGHRHAVVRNINGVLI